MLQLETKGWVSPAIVIALLAIFSYDSFSAKGSADYIFYFLPVALATLHHFKYYPIFVALACTIFSVMGFHLSPDSETDLALAIMNRAFAIISMWAVAQLAHQIIATRNRVNQNSWNKARAVELANAVRGEISTKELVTRVLKFLEQHLSYEVSALYIQKEGSHIYQYLTGYAYVPNDQKLLVTSGEGVLGQAIIEKKMKILYSLPQDHFKIESALGVSSPKHIIVLPFVAEEQTLAVAELGFIKPPTKEMIEFLEQILEPTAISIRSAQNKEKLAQLLTRSQEYAKDLQAQQEELRIMNEELEQQSQILKQSHTRLEKQQIEIEQTNIQLEEQTLELLNQKNILNEKNIELQKWTNEIKKASNYKSEFLANMSHELRTPLNSTLILAKLLADNKTQNLTKEQVEYAQIIYNSGNDLLALINDILDLSKVEAGKMNVNVEVVNLAWILKNLEQIFNPIAAEKKISLIIDFDQNSPAEIITDRLRLEQILKNFLSNAFKFTQEGEVILKVKAEGMKINFSVSDTGQGISSEEEQLIFESFRQADGTSNRKHGGTGLGLSISKELSKLLGGEINLKSTKGKGSTFTLSLPHKINDQKNSSNNFNLKVTPEVTTQNNEVTFISTFTLIDDRHRIDEFTRSMLIIEDDETFAKVLLELANEMGFAGIVAESADEGILLAKQFRPNAIVLDIRLPDHNGLIVLDHLKLDTSTRHIPIHVISAHDFSRSAMEMGAIGHMLKPVDNQKLQLAFKNMITLLEKDLKHILVIEDDPVQKKHISELISDNYVQVTAVETSKEALELLSQKNFDCMIMDLSLPDMSGHELLSKLSSENSTYSFPPVIVYTARDLTAQEEQKLRLYSGSIIIKGAKSPERLLSEVTLFLHKVETELPPERQRMLRDLRSREKILENRNILVVDDDVRNIFALTAALELHGANIQTARNGKEALEKLSADIDLILMDIMMPEMDGYEAISRIRAQHYHDLPIIALTAKAMKDDKQKSLEAGANDYLSKPLEMDKLLSLIRVWLPHKSSFS